MLTAKEASVQTSLQRQKNLNEIEILTLKDIEEQIKSACLLGKDSVSFYRNGSKTITDEQINILRQYGYKVIDAPNSAGLEKIVSW